MVFVDDGSTDESFDILWKRVHNDSRITIIRHNYNLGTFYSRFNSALYSKTKYYIGMDTDDILQPYAVQKMNEILRNDQNDTDVFEFRVIGIKQKRFSKEVFTNFFQK